MDPFLGPERHETERFLLRSYQPGDGRLLHDAKAASHDHLARWFPWASRDDTPESDEALARRFRAQHLTNEMWVIAIVSPDGSRLLGGTDFRPDGPLEGWCGEIGMWLHVDESGRGLGTAVLQAMLEWGFSEWPFHRLMWQCDAENLASARIAEKAGMTLEGVRRDDFNPVTGGRRDTMVYAALRRDW